MPKFISDVQLVGSSTDLTLQDSGQIKIGSGSDLKIYHNATNSFIENETGNLTIFNKQDDGDITFATDNGSGGTTDYIKLDGGEGRIFVSKLMRFGDDVQLRLGDNNDIRLYHDSTSGNGNIENHNGHLYITNYADDSDIKFLSDNGSGGTEIYFELQGVSGGANPFTVFPDNSYAVFGSGHDLRLFHNASNSFLENYTGVLYIDQNQNDGNLILRSDDGSGGLAEYIVCDGGGGGVKVKHYGSTKLETTSTGVTITGGINTSGNFINVGNGQGNSENYLQLGHSRTGDGFAYIDLIGDTTYTDFGLRIIRGNTGANAASTIEHRGTGNFSIKTTEVANLRLQTANATALTLDSSQNATFAGTISNSQFTIPNTAGSAGQVLKWPSSGTTLEWGSGGGGTIDGSGTANDIVMWSDSDTLTDAPIAISGNDATFAGDIDLTSGQLELRGDVALDHDGNSLYIKAPSNIYIYPTNGSSGTAFFSSGGALTIGSSGMTSGNPIITLYGRDTGNNTTDSLTTQVKTNGQAQFTTTGDRIRFDAAQYVQSQKTHIFDGEIFMHNNKWIRVLDSLGNSWNRILGATAGDIVQIGAIASYDTNLGELAFFSNNTERMRLDVSGKLGIGLASPDARLHVHESTNLGGTAGDNLLLRRLSNTGGSGGNNVRVNEWAYRDATGTTWTTWRYHNALSIDSSYGTPNTNTRTFWERDPYNQQQYFGSGSSMAFQINAGTDIRTPKIVDIFDSTYYIDLDDTGTSIRAAGTVHASLSNMSAYQLNGTYIMDSSRNLVNIADITAAGDGQFAGAIRITETGTSQKILIGNQDSGGVNKPAIIRGVNGALEFGRGNDWTRGNEGGTFTKTMEVKSDGNVSVVGRLAVGLASPSTVFHVYGAADDNESLAYIENTYSAGGVFHPALFVKNTHSNHSYGIVAEFRTDTGSGTDRPALLFSNGHDSHHWTVGQGGSGANSNFEVTYRSFHPNTGSGWGTSYLTIGTDGATTISGNVLSNGSGSTGNALNVTRGSDGTTALRVQNTGEVVTQANYFYASAAGTSMYVQNTAVFRGAIINDGNNADVRIADNLTVEGVITVDSLTDRNDSAYYLNPAGQSKLSRIDVVGDIRGTGQQLILNAGEAAAYATGQTNEHVYINAEGGLIVSSSPDNWGSGWSSRHETIIGNASGNSTFPYDIYVGDQIIHSGDTDTYLQFNAADTWRVVVGGSQKLVVNSNGLNVSNGNVYAPRYYDSDNNAFYLDPNGTSVLDTVILKGQTTMESSRASYWDYNDKVALQLMPAANDGAVAILFPSIGNATSDFGYIAFDEDYGEAGVAAGENSALIIGCENDGGGSSDHVRVKGRLVVEADMSSSDPTNAFQVKASNTTTDLFRVARSGDAYFNTDVTINGGDIILNGTGRIQGVDTVSASTDAANKNYVDNAVAGGNLSVLNVDGKKLLDMPNNSGERGPFNPIAVALRRAGRSLYNDPEFVNGSNNVGVYNNQGGTGVQHFRETDTTTLGADAPNDSGYVIRIVNNGNATSPGRGGFVQSIPSEDNHTFVQIFQAKIPTAYSVVIAENSQGNNNTSYWLTNTSGTGKWEWYVRVSHCGQSGTFSSGGHVYLTGGSAGDTITWYLASCELIDVTEADQLSVRKLYAESQVSAPVFYDSNDTTYYVNPTGDTNLIEHGINIHRGTGDSYGPQLIVGQTGRALSYTIQDTNQRPILAATGAYPVLHLNHTVTSNTNHGPTIQFTHNGNASRQWVFGSTGDGEHLDIGFSNSTQGNTSWNPHNGIAGYLGTTFMRFNENGNIGIGAAGDWGGTSGAGGDPGYAIDTRGALYNNTSITCAGTIQGDYFVGTQYASEGYTIYKGYDNWNHMITIRGKTRPGQGKSQAAILGGHQTSFVEYAENNDTTGWYFIGSSGSTYEEIARITKGGGFTQTGNITASADILANGHFYGRSASNAYSNIYRMGGIYFTWSGADYGTNTHHSIRSTYGDTYGDDLTINTFHHLRINLDANNNNTDERFEIGHNTTGTGNTLFSIDGNAKMTLGRSGINPQFEMMFLDSGSGAGWDTAIHIGRTDDLPEGTGFPAYVQTGGYGTMIKANSDGVFFGMEQYSSGNYRPIIQWGDDDSDTPFRIKHENGSEMEVSYNGVVSATTAFEAGRVKVTTGSIAASDAGTKGLVIHGNYTDGKYAHRFRKQDLGGNVVLFLDQSGSSANSFTQLMRFGHYSGNSHEFEVFGDIKATIDMHAGRYYDANATSYYIEPGDGSKIKNIGVNTDPDISASAGYINIVNSNGIHAIKIDAVAYSSAMKITTVPYAGGIILNYNRGTSGFTTGSVMSFQHNGASAGSITVTSSNTTSYGTSSDYRLKENIVELTGAITRVKQLQPKRFNFISDDDNVIFDGFLAHEAKTVVPESVIGEKDEVDHNNEPVYQNIDQSKLVPLLTAALKEAIQKIEDLEARVQTLEN